MMNPRMDTQTPTPTEYRNRLINCLTGLYHLRDRTEYRAWLIDCLIGLYQLRDRKNNGKHFELMCIIGDFNRMYEDMKITQDDFIGTPNPWEEPGNNDRRRFV